MVLSTVQELLPKYDKVRSYSTGGSFDNYFMKKFHLTMLLNFKPFESFYIRTYSLPFARSRFIKEIRYDLVEFLNHLRTLQLKGKGTPEIDQSAELISERLKKLPTPKKKDHVKLSTFWKIFTWCIPSSMLISTIPFIFEYLPLVLLVGIMALIFLIPLVVDRFFKYLTEKHWYYVSQKDQGIDKLKKQLLNELVKIDKS